MQESWEFSLKNLYVITYEGKNHYNVFSYLGKNKKEVAAPENLITVNQRDWVDRFFFLQ